MATASPPRRPGGIQPGFKWRMVGTPAPVFPGFEIDISDRVADAEKPDAVWHRERARAILRTHPEVRELMGHTPSTAFWCVAVAVAQVAIALALIGQSFWLVIAIAWLVGGWLNVCLFMLAHECNHNLVFKKTLPNRILYTFTTMPMFLTGHHTWWVEHHTHHNDLGATKDFIKRRRTFLLATRYLSPLVVPFSLFMLVTQFLRATLGLVVYLGSLLRGRLRPGKAALAILSDEHLVSGYERYGITRWAVWYSLASLTFVGAVFAWGGWMPVIYLFFAQAFMTGFLHPLIFGMILSNSHFHGSERYQPSASYYGWLNWISFNFGLHTEHHDIEKIPWSRLPQVRKFAPEFYDDLVITRSYVALAFKFIFGGRGQFAQHFDNEEHRNEAMFDSGDAADDVPETVAG